MDKSKQSQCAAALNKQLDYLLSVFDKNKEWADIGNWLAKVEQALAENRSPVIKERFMFGKRLAQCLSPKLPAAIHAQVLSVYQKLFENARLFAGGFNQQYCSLIVEMLHLYSIGLFPFFSNAATKNKFIYVDIVKQYFLPLQLELIPCLPGLILSLLPVLEENNELLN